MDKFMNKTKSQLDLRALTRYIPLDSVGGCVPGPPRLNSLMSFAGFEPGLAPLALRDPRWAQL